MEGTIIQDGEIQSHFRWWKQFPDASIFIIRGSHAHYLVTEIRVMFWGVNHRKMGIRSPPENLLPKLVKMVHSAAFLCKNHCLGRLGGEDSNCVDSGAVNPGTDAMHRSDFCTWRETILSSKTSILTLQRPYVKQVQSP